MKKAILTLLGLTFLVICTHEVSGQVLPFTKKKSYLTIGYGYPYVYASNFKTVKRYTEAQYGVYDCSILGPIYANYEYAIHAQWGIGLAASYTSADYSAEIGDELSSYTMSRLGFAFRAAWHPIRRASWDPYVTGSLGYNVEIGEEYIDPERFKGLRIPAAPDFIYNAAIGIRYFRPEKSVGFYLEAGVSNQTYLQGGIAVRFGPDTEYTTTVWSRTRR